uniref:Uncharacterized protein n=1 Tax=Tetranychus urticae TaxID=32264 RepID=T1L2W2_TETUR
MEYKNKGHNNCDYNGDKYQQHKKYNNTGNNNHSFYYYHHSVIFRLKLTSNLNKHGKE